MLILTIHTPIYYHNLLKIRSKAVNKLKIRLDTINGSTTSVLTYTVDKTTSPSSWRQMTKQKKLGYDFTCVSKLGTARGRLVALVKHGL